MTTRQPRQPAGITIGGQYATAPHSEADVVLPAGTTWEAPVWGGRRDGEIDRLPLVQLVTTDKAMREVLASGRQSQSSDEPVLVRAREDDPTRWEIADGHHRVAQAILEGHKDVLVQFDTVFDDEPYEGELYDFSQHVAADAVPSVTPCELCGAPAVIGFQAYTPRGKVGEPSYACEEHRRAPTYATFGGGWYETVRLPAPAVDAADRYVVTARRVDGTPVYVGFEVDLGTTHARVVLTLAPRPMSERAARRTARLAQRDDDLRDVEVGPA